MNVTHLECAACHLEHEARRLHNLCRNCGKPLLVRYDMERVSRTLTKESLGARRADLWRYREVLPVENDENVVTLGEGWTPLLHAERLGKELGIESLYIKDESQNPTQSFKARGMSAAVSMAKELEQKSSRSLPLEMQPAPLQLMRPARDWSVSSSCQTIRRAPTSWNVSRPALMSR
jgi:threonine synthase